MKKHLGTLVLAVLVSVLGFAVSGVAGAGAGFFVHAGSAEDVGTAS